MFKSKNSKITMRLFLTSDRSFKNETSINKSMNNEIKNLIIYSSMPKFVWIAEISNFKLFKQGKAFGLIIIDATTTGIDSFSSIIFIFYSNKYILFDKELQIIYSEGDDYIYDIYKNNLRED